MEIKFTRTPNHIAEMLIVKNFTKRQRGILDLIIRLTYGCQVPWALYKNSDFYLTGLHRGNIARELRQLVEMKIIEINPDLEIDGEKGVIRINPKIDEWMVGQNKNIDPKDVPKLLRKVLAKQLNHVRVLKTLPDEAFDKIDDKIYHAALIKKLNKNILTKNREWNEQMKFFKEIDLGDYR